MEYINVGVNRYFCYKYVGDGRRAWLSSVSEKKYRRHESPLPISVNPVAIFMKKSWQIHLVIIKSVIFAKKEILWMLLVATGLAFVLG